MKRLRSLRAMLPIAALTLSWTLMAQGPGGNQAQAPASFSSDPLVQSLKWRNIGNANLIGRISSIDALENDFAHVIVGSASGGVWKSTNAGTTWTPIFDNYGVGVDRRRRDQPEGPEHHLGRHRRRVRAQLRGVGRRHLQVHRRRQDVHEHGAEGDLQHRHDRPAPDRSQHRLRRGDRQHLGKIGERGFFKTIDGGKTWTKLTNGLPTTAGPAPSKRGWIRRIRTCSTSASGSASGPRGI